MELTERCIECLHFVVLEEMGTAPLSFVEVVQFALLYVYGVHLDGGRLCPVDCAHVQILGLNVT